MFNIGDRIFGHWEPEWLYPGVIVGRESNGVEVQFDDGDRRMMTEDKVRPFGISVGMRVSCRWQGGEIYFEGAISAVTGHAIAIDYDDGDQEVTTVSLIRVRVTDLR